METEREIVTLNGDFYLKLLITTVSGMETERQIAMLVDATATWRENTLMQPLVAMLQARIRRRVAGTSLPRYSCVHCFVFCTFASVFHSLTYTYTYK